MEVAKPKAVSVLPLPKPARLCARMLSARKDMNARPKNFFPTMRMDWFRDHAVDFGAFATFSSLAAAVSKPLQMCIRTLLPLAQNFALTSLASHDACFCSLPSSDHPCQPHGSCTMASNR